MKKPLFIKKLKINYIRGFFKPQFEARLKLKHAGKVFFKANKLTDVLEMSGFGMKKDTTFGNVTCDNLKVSENSQYEAALLREVKRHTKDCDEWHVCYLTFDFDQGKVFTEIWYKSKAGMKDYKKFESNID